MLPQRKKCTKCGEHRPVERFSKKSDGKYGLRSWCKDCVRRYGRQNPEARRKYNREYYEKHREAIAAYSRRYYEENRESVREYNRRYREENLESERELQRRRNKKRRDISREVATRTGELWTESEDRFILVSDMTSLEVAVELGRTESSVVNRKILLRRNLQTV